MLLFGTPGTKLDIIGQGGGGGGAVGGVGRKLQLTEWDAELLPALELTTSSSTTTTLNAHFYY